MISAIASSAASAPSPSAARTTSSPCIAPSVIRPSTLAASTGWPSSLRMVTFTDCPAAAFASSAAGRACSPTLLATVTRRSGMIRPLVLLLAGSGRGRVLPTFLVRLAAVTLAGLAAPAAVALHDARVGFGIFVHVAARGLQIPLRDHEAEQ